MSHRQAQIESLLKRTVATVLQRGLSDPRIKGLVSVTHVDTSPDLRNATVFVSVLPEQYESSTIHGLTDATMHIQQQVKKAVALRLVPHLRFKLDRDLKKQAAVFAAIDEAMQRTAPPGSQDHNLEAAAEEPRSGGDEAADHPPSPRPEEA
jgi:ribosome-binding factor A